MMQSRFGKKQLTGIMGYLTVTAKTHSGKQCGANIGFCRKLFYF
jgi:hypothetical protein